MDENQPVTQQLPDELTDEQAAELLPYTHTPSPSPEEVIIDVPADFFPQPAAEGVIDVDPELFQAAKNQPSAAESYWLGTTQGLTFQLADEIAGGVESFFTGEDYATVRDQYRAAFRQAQKANPGSFIAGEVTGGLATAFIPGFGWANAGVRGAALAGAAYGFGVGEGDFGTQAEEVLKGAAMGAGAAAVLRGVGKAIRTYRLKGSQADQFGTLASEAARQGTPLTKKETAALADLLTDRDTAGKLAQRADKLYENLPKNVKGSPVEQSSTFQNWFMYRPAGTAVGRKGRKDFNTLWSQLNAREKQATRLNFHRSESLRRAVVELRQEGFYIKDPLQTKALRYLQDPLHKGVDIDRAFGTNVEGAVASFSDANHRVALAAEPFLKRITALQPATRKAFGAGGMKKATQLLESGKWEGVTDQQRKVLTEWRSWFDDIQQHLTDNGLKVQHRANYTPHMMADASEIKLALQQRFDTAMKTGTPITQDQEFMTAIKLVGGGDDFTNPADIQRVIDSVLTQQWTSQQLGRVAKNALEREVGVPTMIRQMDLDKAALGYLSTNLKALYYRKPLQSAWSNIQALRGLGANNSAEWLTRYMSRMSGSPSSGQAALLAAGEQWKHYWRRYLGSTDATGLRRAAGNTMLQLPDFMGWATSQIYPNLLGWNVYAPLRNMTQTLQLTAPEIGGRYGFEITRRGWTRALRDRKAGEKATAFLQSKGLISDQFVGEAARRSVEEGLRMVPGVKKIEQFSKLGLSLYSHSDTLNRFITYKIGQELGTDLMKGAARATQVVSKFPPGVRNQIRKAVAAGNADAVEDLIGRWLIRKTQFNYGKAGLSDFGQDWGRVASMFMKWTQVIGSDIASMAQYEQGLRKISKPAAKYLAPLMLFGAGHAALNEMGVMDNPRAQLLIGRSLLNHAPASSMLLTGPPPIISTAFKTGDALKTALQGELDLAGHKVKKALGPFIPGLGAVNRITQTGKQALGINPYEKE